MTPSTLSLLLTATMMLSGCGKAPVDSAKTSKPTLANMKGIPCFACGDGRFMCGGTPREHADYCIEKPDKAAAPETSGPYTIIPLPKIVKVEPPPAMHHPSLPPPKVEKHRRRKKRPDAVTDANLKICDADGCRPLSEADRMRLCGPKDECRHPAMTPQQFTDFMDDNFPSDPNPPYKMELCGGPTGCRPLTAEEINHLMREQPPIYPPSYKMPKGDQP